MRLVRYLFRSDTPFYGWLLDDMVGPIEGSPFGEYRRLEADISIHQVTLCSPVTPGKVIGIVHNYKDHASEMGEDPPAAPVMFLKPPSSLIGNGEVIVLPPQSRQVMHEAQLAIVIGQKGRWIELEDALNHVLGYTIANDITARDLQRRDGQWTRSKSFDTFCPLGPWIETELDATDVIMTCRVNGELRQMVSTHEMLFTIAQLITFVSSVMTLEAGDVLLTGSPGGASVLNHGDTVQVEIEGIGELVNTVWQE